jgi:hypothetical protein
MKPKSKGPSWLTPDALTLIVALVAIAVTLALAALLH